MSGKLTKAQAALLRDVEHEDNLCVKGYHPARAVVAKGYAEWFDDDEYGGRLRLLPAGRAALQQKGDDDGR